MKILKENDININDTVPEIKDALLYRVYLAIGVIGIPTIFLGVVSSAQLEHNTLGIWNALTFLPSLIVLLKYRKFPYAFKSNLLIGTLVAIGAINLYVGAIFGASLIILLTAIGLSTLLFEKKTTYFWVFTASVVLIIFSVLFITGVLKLDVDYIRSSVTISSWATAIFLFFWLGGLFAISFNFLFRKLNNKINLIHKNEQELERKNENLLELLKEKEQNAKELLKAKLKAEESNQLKMEFLHNMSHEVRTPLNGIMGFSKLLKKEDLSFEKRVQFADIIVNSSEKLQKVIDDILEISFLETKQISISAKLFNVYEFLNDLYLVFLVVGKKGIELKMNCPDENLNIKTDQHKVHKILSNLIENALKFTENGYVEFGFSDVKNGKICLYVKDTGIGISEENLEKIFNRFTQEHDNISSKFGGLGLGLSIAKENALLLGGNIRVVSDKNSGTVFYVEIPTDFKE